VIARHFGWNNDDAEEIRIAAPMHDIGKIGIPDNILKEPDRK
jgi:putative two-component system response regulator